MDQQCSTTLVDKVKMFIIRNMLDEDSTPVRIVDHLFIGSMAAAFTKEKLKECNESTLRSRRH